VDIIKGVKEMLKQNRMKKVLAVLLAVLFVTSLSAVAASARGGHGGHGWGGGWGGWGGDRDAVERVAATVRAEAGRGWRNGRGRGFNPISCICNPVRRTVTTAGEL